MKNKLGFTFSHFRGDLLGGITAGIVALPLALAFGLQSGLGADAGIYGAIFISFFAALFGGTNTQISGPTAPMTAVSMIVIAGMIATFEGDLTLALPAILAVFILSGIFQIVLGLLKIGSYIRYIPYPVVSGFMSGIGVIILITQMLPLMGYYPKEDSALIDSYKVEAKEILLNRVLLERGDEATLNISDYENVIRSAPAISAADIEKEAKTIAASNSSGVIGSLKTLGRAIHNINFTDLIIGLVTIFIIYGFKRITTAIPSTLVALILVTLGAFFILGPEGYKTIGTIPSGFPPLRWEIFSEFSLVSIRPYIFTALSLALLGAIDSLLTSVVADNMTKTKHNPNKELIGQGIGNSIAAIFGGIPGAGATIRTVVNINSGGKTKLSGMMAGVLLLMVLLVLGPTASMIPAAVLAGILVTVGIGVLDYRGIRSIPYIPKSEVLVMVLVLILTVFVGLIEAVAIGLVFASILFMKSISDVVEHRTKAAPLQEFSREVTWKDEEKYFDKIKDKVYIKHLDGPLFFGFASRFQDMFSALPQIEIVVIRMDKVPYVDQSGLIALEDAILDLSEKDIKVAFTDLHGQPLDMFKQYNILPKIVPEEQSFESFEDCMAWIKEALKTK
ncbi:MAG: SulP family inorganic anion transporter [Saprospiraceae bacterium]|nr:SulP family inorganic anion transporter [Saprospiraceae bacterium]